MALTDAEFRRVQRALNALSPRRLLVAEYLADGYSRQEIALALEIGVRTVESHVEYVRKRLCPPDGASHSWIGPAAQVLGSRRVQCE